MVLAPRGPPLFEVALQNAALKQQQEQQQQDVEQEGKVGHQQRSPHEFTEVRLRILPMNALGSSANYQKVCVKRKITCKIRA
jgi:hypothetical protein